MTDINYTKGQLNSLVVLRLFIGWHFLYEGVLKLYNPSWTAKGYLLSSQGFLKGVFQWLASDSIVGVVDALNIVVLVGVGLTLILGLWTRWSSIAGFLILIMYYLSHPSFPGLPEGPSEGSYWIINKNLIEAVALLVLYQFPTSQFFGLEVFWKRKKSLKEVVN